MVPGAGALAAQAVSASIGIKVYSSGTELTADTTIREIDNMRWMTGEEITRVRVDLVRRPRWHIAP